jgi:hypothetical protein
VVNRWSAVIYGFAELDAIHDSLQGPNDLMGNAALPRSGTYAASHDQTTFSVRNSRLGLKVGAPEWGLSARRPSRRWTSSETSHQ